MEKKKVTKEYIIYVFPTSGVDLSKGITLYQWFRYCGIKNTKYDMEYIKSKDKKLFSLSEIVSYICTELGYSLVSFTRYENSFYVTLLKD